MIDERFQAETPEADDRYGALRAELARAVRRLCPPWLADRREDLVQVALLKVLAAERGAGERELSAAYLTRAAYCALIDEIRRLRSRREVPLESEERATEIAGRAPGPQQAAEGAELGRGIRACLGRLVRPRRLAVTLNLVGHGVPEIARLLGGSAKRTENLVYRGLDDLRRCLREKGLAP